MTAPTYPGSTDVPMGDVVLDAGPFGRIRIDAVSYHRNGVAGRPFSTVTFRPTRGDARGSAMLAVIPSHGDDEPPDYGEVYVVALDNPSDRWRGDVLADVMHDALRVHERRWAAAIDAYHAAVAS